MLPASRPARFFGVLTACLLAMPALSQDTERSVRVMLPTEAEVGSDIDFDFLSNKYEMSGGYIKNAVLRAAFLAADDKSPITMRHMMRAANLEYSGMGKVVSHHLGHFSRG
jgi:hypothetical protein